MREDRRRRYDDGFRREALELIKAGASGNTLARRLAIPVYTARNWIRLYRSGGEEAVMGGNAADATTGRRRLAAARDHVENGMTKTEVMAEVRDREHRAVGTAGAANTGREAGGAQAEAQGQAQRLEIQTETRTHARAGARRTGRLPEGEGRVPGKTPGPAGAEVTRRERSAVVRLLAGRTQRWHAACRFGCGLCCLLMCFRGDFTMIAYKGDILYTPTPDCFEVFRRWLCVGRKRQGGAGFRLVAE